MALDKFTIEQQSIHSKLLMARAAYAFGSYKIAHLLEPVLFYHGKVKVLPIGFDKDFKFPKRRLAKKQVVVSSLTSYTDILLRH